MSQNCESEIQQPQWFELVIDSHFSQQTTKQQPPHTELTTTLLIIVDSQDSQSTNKQPVTHRNKNDHTVMTVR